MPRANDGNNPTPAEIVDAMPAAPPEASVENLRAELAAKTEEVERLRAAGPGVDVKPVLEEAAELRRQNERLRAEARARDANRFDVHGSEVPETPLPPKPPAARPILGRGRYLWLATVFMPHLYTDKLVPDGTIPPTRFRCDSPHQFEAVRAFYSLMGITRVEGKVELELLSEDAGDPAPEPAAAG